MFQSRHGYNLNIYKMQNLHPSLFEMSSIVISETKMYIHLFHFLSSFPLSKSWLCKKILKCTLVQNQVKASPTYNLVYISYSFAVYDVFLYGCSILIITQVQPIKLWAGWIKRACPGLGDRMRAQKSGDDFGFTKSEV